MATWTKCGVLQNFAQTLKNITSTPIEVSTDGSTVADTLDEDDTYAISAGVQVWVRSQDATPGAAWRISVDGSYDDTTTID